MPKIELKNVSVLINNVSILKDITTEIEHKTITALIGPSGSGKSTLLKTFNRLIDIASGQILIDGKDITGFKITELRQKIGIVLQHPVLFSGTVEDNLKYGPCLTGNRDIGYEHHCLELVRLDKSFYTRDVNTLSGGQQQRISIARTLVNKPEILLLDEPTSALDPSSVEQFEEMIVGLCKNMNLTVVWVTHNMEQAKRVSSETALIINGKIEEQGDTKTIFGRPHSHKTFDFITGKMEEK